jgi:malate synthase
VKESKFVPGLFANKPHERAPDFVVCEGAISVAKMREALNNSNEEWINFQIKTPMNVDPEKPRRLTVAINDWKPETGNERKAHERNAQPKQASMEDDFEDDIPF